MAISNNPLTKGLSGRIGHVIFRQQFGKTVICSRPRKNKKPTVNQLAARENFKNASIYANIVMKDATLKRAYKARAKPGQSAYNVALVDFLMHLKESKLALKQKFAS